MKKRRHPPPLPPLTWTPARLLLLLLLLLLVHHTRRHQRRRRRRRGRGAVRVLCGVPWARSGAAEALLGEEGGARLRLLRVPPETVDGSPYADTPPAQPRRRTAADLEELASLATMRALEHEDDYGEFGELLVRPLLVVVVVVVEAQAAERIAVGSRPSRRSGEKDRSSRLQQTGAAVRMRARTRTRKATDDDGRRRRQQ